MIDDVFSEQRRFDFILGYEMTGYFIKNVDIPAGMRAVNYFRATRSVLRIERSPRNKSSEFRPRIANIWDRKTNCIRRPKHKKCIIEPTINR